jgi:hypothetical protein
MDRAVIKSKVNNAGRRGPIQRLQRELTHRDGYIALAVPVIDAGDLTLLEQLFGFLSDFLSDFGA